MCTQAIKPSNRKDFSKIYVFLFLGVAVAIQLGFFVYWFGFKHGQPLSQGIENWGQFGDYVGGVLNPLVSFTALLWLMRSVTTQERELAITRQALVDAAQAQNEQLSVMRKDQDLASMSALVEARTFLLQEAIRNHQFYLNQLRANQTYLDIKGNVINFTNLKLLLEQSNSSLTSVKLSHDLAIKSLEEKMI